VDYRAVELLPREQAEQLRAIPLRLHPDDTISVAVADLTDETWPSSSSPSDVLSGCSSPRLRPCARRGKRRTRPSRRGGFSTLDELQRCLAARNAQFLQDRAHVRAHGDGLDEEAIGDLEGRQAVAHQLEYLPLPIGQHDAAALE
jgi:hypothetical protein